MTWIFDLDVAAGGERLLGARFSEVGHEAIRGATRARGLGAGQTRFGSCD